MTMTSSQYKVIGTRPLRPDGVDKVTGRAHLMAPTSSCRGCCTARCCAARTPTPASSSIDTSAAQALPGVRAVVTAQDMPSVGDKMTDLGETVVNLRYMSNNILAHDKVLYHGHAVAAVAADNPHIAEEAARLIKVEYEVLPHVLDGRAAMASDAPILLPDLRTDELGKLGQQPTNVAEHIRHQRGDLAAGFAAADVDRRARVSHGDGAPGLYRAPCHGRAVERRRPDSHLVQHAGGVWRAGTGGRVAPGADLTRRRHPDGDRRRLWRQEQRLSRAGGGAALAQGRAPAGQDDDDARRGARRHRPDVGLLHPRQDGRHARRQADGSRGGADLRGRRLSRLAGRRRLRRHLWPVQAGQRADRRL